jgi:hypothetical protein
MPVDRIILYILVIATWASLLGVILVYGLLTPWYKSRTGIGFMSTKVSFFLIISLTIIGALWWKIPSWMAILSWGLIVVTINYGITWNIIYKQFFENRTDDVNDKNPSAGQAGVGKGTGEPRANERNNNGSI